jgi:hypothetical protein
MQDSPTEFPRRLSKSKLISFRQCPKRLWLELHRPELAEVSASAQAIFRTGHQVGDLARALYDQNRIGILIDKDVLGVDGAIAETQAILSRRLPIFEAGLAGGGGLAFADILLPAKDNAWRMVEVKASASVKEYQREDVAIQAYVAKSAGVALTSVAVAHIDSKWTYAGDGDYRGLLREVDCSDEAFSRSGEVSEWVRQAHEVAWTDQEPAIKPGSHCTEPFECGFANHCNEHGSPAVHPVRWLPRIQAKELKTYLAEHAVAEMSDVPAELLNEQQLRVKECTIRNETFFDSEGARRDLDRWPLPVKFLDFETIMFAVPIWAGTRPFQQIPFQFSLHHVGEGGEVDHTSFLDLSGSDPSHAFACALLWAAQGSDPVFVYNAAFEATRIEELALRFPELAVPLSDLRQRLVDLYPIALRRFYAPSQQGSWSIKRLLPAVVPSLTYEDLDGVADGGMAQEAYLKAISAECSPEWREDLRRELLRYCRLDTWGMVKIWEVFSGSTSNLKDLE